MNKFLVSVVAAVSLLSAVVPVAHAATVSGAFNVGVTLTSVCLATNVTAPTLSFGAYVAFQTLAQPSAGSVAITFKCTRGIPTPSVAFDPTNGTAAGVGVIAGLQYTLTAAADAGAAGTDASNTALGTDKTLSYAVSGTMPAGQAGTCATLGSCVAAPIGRTLIVTY